MAIKVMLSAGGTGGHMFPAVALAEELTSKGGFDLTLATDPRGLRFVPKDLGMPVHCFMADTLRPGLKAKIIAAFRLSVGLMQALMVLMREKPDVVVGFGGYPSFPAVFAAAILGIPTILHEQNAVLGKANAFMAKYATKLALSLPPPADAPWAGKFDYEVTGNPLRRAVAAIAFAPYPTFTGQLNILVVGGSLGARVFSDVVPDAILRLKPEQRHMIRLTQQVREEAIDDVRGKYAAAGFPVEIAPFFADMPQRLAACHLFIGRSGASTVAEIAAAGRPAIWVPATYHADQQQKRNVEALVSAGGAWLMEEKDFTPDALAAKISEILADPAQLPVVSTHARACGKADAASKLAALVSSLAK
jgi:UDP-N-acetylglucosamine--N-acetylmuramyl-(pentapeptide) pyrophosphoryl-undecaprenol N-acetylglucosamine transferase